MSNQSQTMDQNLYNTIATNLQDAFIGQSVQLDENTHLIVDSIDGDLMQVIVTQCTPTGECTFKRFGFLL